MRSLWIPWQALLAAALFSGGALGSLGCSKSSSGCDPCAAGNQCIDDGTGPACHEVCSTQADCPANWYCNDGRPGAYTVSWCVPSTTPYPAVDGGWNDPPRTPWPCTAGKGEGANPDCDWNLGFACYATSPTDAYAFCTQFACASDADCPGGWWCSTQNVGPNATSTAPTYGKTRTVCVPRTYCAPCKKDLDCYAPPGSPPVHCVPDVTGAGYCSTQCSNDSNCAVDAVCRAPWKVCTPSADAGAPCQNDDQCPPTGGSFQHCVTGNCTPECASASDCAAGATGQKCVANTTVCIPRAGVCVGDGGFCSPCRSDDDCVPKTQSLTTVAGRGYCLSGQPYSTERFCSAPATVADCDAQAPDPVGCPQPQPSDNWIGTGCTTLPPDQCVGVVSFASSTPNPIGIAGCWTVNR